MPNARRPFLVAVILLAGACVPAEYRSGADLSEGAPTDIPDILPLADVLTVIDDVSAETPVDQTALEGRNATLAARAEHLATRPAPAASSQEQDQEQELQNRAEALRGRADAVRTQQ